MIIIILAHHNHVKHMAMYLWYAALLLQVAIIIIHTAWKVKCIIRNNYYSCSIIQCHVDVYIPPSLWSMYLMKYNSAVCTLDHIYDPPNKYCMYLLTGTCLRLSSQYRGLWTKDSIVCNYWCLYVATLAESYLNMK